MSNELGTIFVALGTGVWVILFVGWCSWLEYRLVLKERLLKRARTVGRTADAAQLVFETPVEDAPEDDGAGAFVRRPSPIYHSATPVGHPFEWPV
jgi:hypothetical protein